MTYPVITPEVSGFTFTVPAGAAAGPHTVYTNAVDASAAFTVQ